MNLINYNETSHGIAEIHLNNPPVNALTYRCVEEFRSHLDKINRNEEIRVVLIRGKGNIFSAGGDLSNDKSHDVPASAKAGDADVKELIDEIATCTKPVVAGIRGHCVGGGLELALSCDIRIASESARFVAPGVNLGLVGSTARLVRAIGFSRASSMVLTGEAVDAVTAERWGLVTGVYPDYIFPAACLALVQRIASRAPLSVRAGRELLNRAWDLPFDEVVAHERAAFSRLLHTEDHKAALQAFRAKEQPVFAGK